jgi:hypothetical protein
MGQALFGAPAKAYSTSTSSPEHTIYGAGALSGLSFFADGTPSIILATGFYRTGSTTAWRVKGGRVFIPSGATGVPSSVTISAYKIPNGSGPDLNATPVQSKVATGVTAGAWAEVRFDTPFTVGDLVAELAWIAYTFGDGHYCHRAPAVGTAVQAADGSSVYRASEEDTGGDFSRFQIGAGATTRPGSRADYGIDIIFDEG